MLIVCFLYACKKDINQPTQPKEFSDLAIQYNDYFLGSVYVSDTFQTKFKITNYGPATFEIGDTIFAAVEINKVVYGIDLIGSGPTPILLTRPLGINQEYIYNPGYLQRTPTLTYFGLDSLDITLLLYGQSGSPIDTSFPKDINPNNNKSTLRITTSNFYIIQ
jgi:hypothetical protein